ncbi:MAG: HD domain-containing protein [Firmicutes bacterium]|nr:HD domain-containing protein [Bacillota bacterium]
MIDTEKLKKQIPYYDTLAIIAEEMQVEVYLVGGSPRDLVMGRSINDWDFAVSDRIFDYARQVADRTGSAYVLLDQEFGIARVVPRGGKIQLDFALLKGSIEQDLLMRDFAMNSIAINIKTMTAEDPANGMGDIEKKLVRTLARQNITDDPLRILRAYRMASKFGFDIEKDTLVWMSEEKELLPNAAYERIRDELYKILAGTNSAPIIRRLYTDGVFDNILPELKELDGMSQNQFHKYDVLEHTFVAFESIEEQVAKNFAPMPYSDMIRDYIGEKMAGDRTRLENLKFATLMHDIGKPAVRRVDVNGQLLYIGHHTEGRDIWFDIANRFKLSNKEIRFGAVMIEYHLNPVGIPIEKDPVRQRSRTYDFFKNLGNAAPGVLLMSWADVDAGQGEALTREMIDKHHDFSCYLMGLYFSRNVIAFPPKLIDGKRVKELLPELPDKDIGAVIEKLTKAVGLEEVKNVDEAEAFVKNIKPEQGT